MTKIELALKDSIDKLRKCTELLTKEFETYKQNKVKEHFEEKQIELKVDND